MPSESSIPSSAQWFATSSCSAAAVALFLLVWQYKMNQNTSNLTTAAIWILFTLALWNTPAIANLQSMPRSLWTGLFSMGISLILYYTIWTAPPTLAIQANTVIPISVTQIIAQWPPYEEGKPLRIEIEIRCDQAGLKMAGRCCTFVGIADDVALSPEKRPIHEKRIGEQYERDAKGKTPILLSGTHGLITVPVDGPLLTKDDVDALNSPTGVVFIAGQIDYGSGAIDYGGFVRTAEKERIADKGRATLFIEHNGPSSVIAFK